MRTTSEIGTHGPVPLRGDAPAGRAEELLRWLPVAVGLSVLYIPSYLDLARIFWSSEVGLHGPLIVAIVFLLIWRKRGALIRDSDQPKPALGWPVMVAGLLMYAVGRSQQFVQLEIGSQIPLLLGLILALRGPKVGRQLLFPILFLVFLVPIPNSLLDAILLPLKQHVSAVVEHLLYYAGYPIARSGIVLTIGPYQLLIANACSGLNSMVALSGIGLLFIYLMHKPSWLYNGLLLASILPIAFLANIVRVMLLVLVTYYLGDRAGQQFHDYAGYLEIAFAFGGFFALDALLGRIIKRRTPGGERGPAARP